MSKSDSKQKSRIGIIDTREDIINKFQAALTDSQSSYVTYDPTNRPGVANLLEILSILDGRTPAEIAAEIGGSGSGQDVSPLKVLKRRTADAVVHELAGVRERYLEYLTGRGLKWLDDVADKGAEKANANAQVTMKRIKEAVGL